ncbi:uncharacterized protein [Primulina eburnea]|uniref:uncharacterized protein n=1 Tax=Primulina eburnea TaxID=1245227 RepID=UPI003C6C8D9F
MGACASVPKATRGEKTAMPSEQLKEEMSVPTEAAEVEEAIAEEEKVVVENDESQSIGKLLVEEIPKESEGSSQATTVPEIEEYSKPDPLQSPNQSLLLPPNQKRNPPRQLL